MRVIILGASTNREKFGNIAVRAYLSKGHEVFPVNPRADVIEGIPCFHAVVDVPGPIDRAALYLPPPLALEAVRQCADRGHISEIFFNPGTESPEAAGLARTRGLRVTHGCAIIDIGVNPHTL